MKASPLAREIAAEQGVDLAQLKGTGPEGRIVEKRCARGGEVSRRPTAPQRKLPRRAEIQPAKARAFNLTGMRKVIAERLVASKGPVPHFYLNIEIDAGAADARPRGIEIGRRRGRHGQNHG